MNSKIKTGLAISALAVTMTAGMFIGEALAAQPHMSAALSDLRAARSELNMAIHNKGGHRVTAIGLVDQAINEVKAGIDAGE
jgi:hypothetical protein